MHKTAATTLRFEEMPTAFTSSPLAASPQGAAETARLSADRHRGGLTPRQLSSVLRFIDANLSKTIPVRALAAIAGLSPSHFGKAFKANLSLPPYAHIVRQRIERAMILLAKGEMPLVEVALACGFSDQSHFTRHFRRLVGMSPWRWRRSLYNGPKCT
jgi:AraC family transcriptional regulator